MLKINFIKEKVGTLILSFFLTIKIGGKQASQANSQKKQYPDFVFKPRTFE